MYLPSPAVVPEFLEEGVELDDASAPHQFGRSRVVWGRNSRRPYLVRWGLLKAIAERVYYEWACSRGLGARPVQFARRADGRIRHLSMIWWTDGAAEHEATSSLDIPRLTALDVLLDNSSRPSGWMFEGSRVYRLFNHHALGLGFGPVPLLTRFRLLKEGGMEAHLNLEESASSFDGEEREAFHLEASSLATLTDESLRDLCRLPRAMGSEAFRFCARALGKGPGSREVMKLLLRSGPDFMEEYAYEYIRARRLAMAAQLKLGRRA